MTRVVTRLSGFPGGAPVMVFSSQLFLFGFLPFALLLYYLAPRRARHFVLNVASYVFYGWSHPLFCVLMFVSTLIDYVAGRLIAGAGPNGEIPLLVRDGPRSFQQRAVLTASVMCNLGLLGFFKYFNFGVESYNGLVHWLGLSACAWESVLRVTLPLGISFYTFQSLSYTIDVYRGDARALRNFMDFSCFVSMFPQLVAGPIIRFQEVSDQLASRTHTLAKFARGVAFVALGLSKKVLLANSCGQVADVAFAAGTLTPLDAWLGLLGYSFQIYFDFSGYSDMAIGLGLMLGFMFAKNFDSPYSAESITDFWRRWHISLSSWLRDYLYIPLGGNRRGTARTYFNLAVVMLLGGLWHGAAWHFVLWGAIHGLALIVERLLGKNRLSLPRAVRIALTFLLVSLAWIVFRAENVPHAVDYAGALVALSPARPEAGLIGSVTTQPFSLTTLAVAAIVVWMCPSTWEWTKTLTFSRGLLVLALFWLSVSALSVQEFNPFIYFIF